MQLYKEMYFLDNVLAPALMAQHQPHHPGLQRVYNKVNRLHIYNIRSLAMRSATVADQNTMSVEDEDREWANNA